MTNTIYIDVLILLNIYVSYFLFLSTKKLLGVDICRSRMLIACAISGLYSIIILLDLNLIELIFIKLAMGISLSAIAFYKKHCIRMFIKATLMFFLVNFIYGGLMLSLFYFITPSTMQFKNGIVYFNISSIMLAVSTIIAYIAISIFSYILNKRNSSSDIYTVTISFLGRQTMLKAFHDTGNKLVDAFTGLPIMVCELSELKAFLPEKLYQYFISPSDFSYNDNDEYLITKRIRIVPISVISGTSSLMAFKPDNITIENSNNHVVTNALIAVTTQKLSDGTFQALLSTSMLNNLNDFGKFNNANNLNKKG